MSDHPALMASIGRSLKPALAAALRDVLTIHHPIDGSITDRHSVRDSRFCDHCTQEWPCDTAAVITSRLGAHNA